MKQFRRNLKNVLRIDDENSENDVDYKSDLEYENEIVRLKALNRMIDDFFDFDLKHWFQINFVRFVTKFDDNLKRVRARANHDLRTLKNFRRQLNEKQFETIVQRLNFRYRLIYSQFKENQITIVFNIENFKTMIEQSFRKSNSLSMNKFVQKKQNDDQKRRIETSSEDRERFFKI